MKNAYSRTEKKHIKIRTPPTICSEIRSQRCILVVQSFLSTFSCTCTMCAYQNVKIFIMTFSKYV